MVFIARQERFVCGHCGKSVEPLEKGSYRNHCPECLWSRHVDRDGPGDRLSECLGMMKPVAIDSTGKKGWMIVHTCEKCGKEIRNIAAPDDDLTGFFQKNETWHNEL
jgi:DNA-directed RNA polymerase subunit RPC12/RpoP